MSETTGDEALPDDTLLARIAGQDRHAFTILMRRHGERIRGLALSFTGRAAEADDIVQDVFLTLWRRPGSWQPGKAAFTTWLYRVVANRCRDYARRQRLRRWLPFAEVPDPPDETPDAFDTLGGRDELARVRGVIRTLPENQRLALLFAVQGEHSTAEIAAVLNVSEGAAEQLLVRARRKLRTMMRQGDGR